MELVLITGLGMAGTIYGIPQDKIIDGRFARRETVGDKVYKLVFKDTGYTKYKSGRHRRVFELVLIKEQKSDT